MGRPGSSCLLRPHPINDQVLLILPPKPQLCSGHHLTYFGPLQEHPSLSLLCHPDSPSNHFPNSNLTDLCTTYVVMSLLCFKLVGSPGVLAPAYLVMAALSSRPTPSIPLWVLCLSQTKFVSFAWKCSGISFAWILHILLFQSEPPSVHFCSFLTWANPIGSLHLHIDSFSSRKPSLIPQVW